MIPDTQQAAISVEEGWSALREFQQTLMQQHPDAKVYCSVHSEIGNIEFLAALNSADGLCAPIAGLSEEELARKFLSDNCKLFRLHHEAVTQYLTLKHTLRSVVGLHLVFELGAEEAGQKVSLDDACFVVHFDQQRHIAMVSAAYEPAYTSDALRPLSADVQTELQEIQAANPSIISITPKYLPDPNTQRYHLGFQIKYKDQEDVAHYCLCNYTEILSAYAIDPTLPRYSSVGQVYHEHWSTRTGEPGMQRVVLSDLSRKRSLMGRYVKVESKISSPVLPAQSHVDPPLFVCQTDETGFDQVMAYYHANLAQLYFRELGLFELDHYPGLVPIRVILSQGAISRFVIPDATDPKKEQDRPGWILLNCLNPDDDKKRTQAREARVIYHEFTHAVTDALARLHRGNLDDPVYRRRDQTQQAAAMDEALGDYFACSLAARVGAAQPAFGILEIDKDQLDEPKWTELRNLVAPRQTRVSALQPGLPLLRLNREQNDANDTPIYRWGELWASYLWQLRCDPEIGPDNADRLIANSLFFLTRWTTFAGGLLALLLTDALLFDGLHLNRIQELARERGLDIAKFELGH